MYIQSSSDLSKFTQDLIDKFSKELTPQKIDTHTPEWHETIERLFQQLDQAHYMTQNGSLVPPDRLRGLQTLFSRIRLPENDPDEKLRYLAQRMLYEQSVLGLEIQKMEKAFGAAVMAPALPAQTSRERVTGELKLDSSQEAQKRARLLSLIDQHRTATSSQQAMRDLAQIEGFSLQRMIPSIAELEAQIRQLFQELQPSLMAAKDINDSYGNKYANLVHMAHLVDTLKINEVEIPEPKGIATKQVASLLSQHAPAVIEAWEELGKMHAMHTDSSILFLQTPEAKAKLALIQEGIQAVFDRAGKEEALYSSLEISKEMTQWMERLRQEGETLMVRSSGAEDSRVMANAGGNASIACVEPSRASWLHAVGQVVSSYFTADSLQNRLNAKTNPFAEPLQLAVATQQFIGESEGSRDIPVSFVVFSNEPLYIGGEKFRLMRICATYGQGEGVVGGRAIANDTFYLLHSEAHPHQLIQWGSIQKKLSRVAPVLRQGKLSLAITPNPPDLIAKPSLNEKQLQAIYRQAVLMESFFGDKATDIEGVCKGGKLYFVQARPVIREGLVPTYVDLDKLGARKGLPTPILDTMESTVLVPGKASVLQVSDSRQLLIRETIEDAEKDYHKDRHELVVVFHQPGENSHPMVNFATMGTSCLYAPKEKEEAVKRLVAKVDATHELVVDMQTGTLFLWDIERAKVDDFVTKGFAVHPAKPSISIPGVQLPLGLVQPVPQELRDLVHGLQVQAIQGVALQRLRQHPRIQGVREKWVALQQSINDLRVKGQPVPFGALQILQTLHTLDRTVQRAFQELEQGLKTDSVLRRLWHAKVLTTLVTEDKPRPGVVGQYSVLQAEPLAQIGQELVSYQSQLPHASSLIDLLLDGRLAPNPKVYEQWREFLMTLEPLIKSGTISKIQVAQFKQQMAALREAGALPLWFTFSFSVPKVPDPVASSFRVASQLLRAIPVKFLKAFRLARLFERIRVAFDIWMKSKAWLTRFTTYLGQTSKEQLRQLMHLQERRQKLEDIRMQFEAFSKPESFPHVWDTLKSEIETFWCSAGMMKEFTMSSSPLVQMTVYQMMAEIVNLLDDAIKLMKQSSFFPNDATKVARFRSMLEPYLRMMQTWSTLVSTTGEALYLDRIGAQIRRMSDSHLSMLFPSGRFNVNEAILGTARPFPQTLEDGLTLLHQQCLHVIARLSLRLLPQEKVAKSTLPDLLKSAIAIVESFNPRLPKIRFLRIGVCASDTQIILRYNVPLGMHSGHFDLVYDKLANQLSFRGYFFGEQHDKNWSLIAKKIEAMQNAGLFLADKPMQKGEHDLFFSWLIRDPSHFARALQEYVFMAERTFS